MSSINFDIDFLNHQSHLFHMILVTQHLSFEYMDHLILKYSNIYIILELLTITSVLENIIII